MTYLRYLNYFIIAFMTSGLSASFFNHINKSHIEDMNSELKKIQEENESLRKEVKLDGNLQKTVSKIDDCLTIIMKEIRDDGMETIDEDLRNEIRNICNRIIDYLPKEKLTLEIDYENNPELSSSESFDKLVGELERIKD